MKTKSPEQGRFDFTQGMSEKQKALEAEIVRQTKIILEEHKYLNLSPNDKAVVELATMCAEHLLSGKPTYEYHGRNSD